MKRLAFLLFLLFVTCPAFADSFSVFGKQVTVVDLDAKWELASHGNCSQCACPNRDFEITSGNSSPYRVGRNLALDVSQKRVSIITRRLVPLTL